MLSIRHQVARLARSRLTLTRLALLVVVAASSSSVQAINLTQIQGKGQFRIAFSTAQPPLISQDKTGVQGFVTELLSVVGKKMKVNNFVWSKAASPDALIDGLQAGRYDAVLDSQLPRPLGGVSISTPLACDGGVILSRPGGPEFEEDLENKRIAVVSGSDAFFYVRNLSFKKKVNVFIDENQALLSFLSGSADALVINRYAALKIFKKAGPETVQVSSLLWSEDVALVFKKGDASVGLANTDVLGPINTVLTDMLKDGSYTALSNKYFGQDVRCER